MKLTPQQEAVVAAVVGTLERGRTEHFVVEAVAGSGKSHTLMAIVERMAVNVPHARILCLQFNQDVCARMRTRLAHHITAGRLLVNTIHAFGLHLLAPAQVDADKAYKSWRRHSTGDILEWTRVRRFLDDVRHRGWMPPENLERPLTLEMTILDDMLCEREILDLEDGVYHCLRYQVRVPEPFHLVLVDEAQDLNDANHQFLRDCIAPVGSGTVVCGVGDPAQAIYAFRGANPESMAHFRRVFAATTLPLTCCFRCPRRVVAVAACLNKQITAAPHATPGMVRIRSTSSWMEETVNLATRPPLGEVTLFAARGNATVLSLVRYLFRMPNRPLLPEGCIRWMAPALVNQLREVLALWGERTLNDVCGAANDADLQPLERSTLRVLEVARHLDGAGTQVQSSLFLQFACRLLERNADDGPDIRLVLATIHGAKGAEFEHVILHQYHLLGGPEDEQDGNLLYIAVTRAVHSLTFLMTDSTRHVLSPLLPLELIHSSVTDA